VLKPNFDLEFTN